MNYPRVLVVALGRVNAEDSTNNGLLLRNVFGQWPRHNIAQLYSSGNNGDEGFFGSYYQLAANDRRFGRLFYGLKPEIALAAAGKDLASVNYHSIGVQFVREWARRLMLDTGLYELVFRPRLSDELITWVEDFRPEILFAQGYTLAFTWLPLMLSAHFNVPIVYYPTDDWAGNRYLPGSGAIPISQLARRAVIASSRTLVEQANVRIAFNSYMSDEYLLRYQKTFTVLMHGDDPERFCPAPLSPAVKEDEHWIISIGDFDRHRLPLLLDLDHACDILRAKGLAVGAKVYPVDDTEISRLLTGKFRNVQILPCPSHTALVPILTGADVLFLPERFDETSNLVRLSVSSKAPLFMLSGQPIVVYSDPITGIARYANEDGWAAVVDRRDPRMLADTIEGVITDSGRRRHLIATARSIAMKNHYLPGIQSKFHDLLCSAINDEQGLT